PQSTFPGIRRAVSIYDFHDARVCPRLMAIIFGLGLTDQLLSGIRFHRAKAVVIDMTGVGTLSANVAEEIIRAGEACRLLGASIIMTGLSHAIADTLVRVGVDLTR